MNGDGNSTHNALYRRDSTFTPFMLTGTWFSLAVRSTHEEAAWTTVADADAQNFLCEIWEV